MEITEQQRMDLINAGWTPPKGGPCVKPVRMCIIKQTEHEDSITSYARIQDYRQARKDAISKLWAHPEHHQAIKAFAESLSKQPTTA